MVGQGLAGTNLAWACFFKGVPFKIIDEHAGNDCSALAAGLMNPITGRALVKSWLFDDLIAAAVPHYKRVEEELSKSLLIQLPILRVFQSQKEANDFDLKSEHPDYQKYISVAHDLDMRGIRETEYGSGLIKGGYRLDVSAYIETSRAFFLAKELLEIGVYEERELEQGERLVYCEGHRTNLNEELDIDVMRPVRGELYILHCDGVDPLQVIKKGFLAVPWKNPGEFWFGATYDHHNLVMEQTERGVQQLEKKLEAMFDAPVKVLRNFVGMRPATKDRRPIIGSFKEGEEKYLFNGFGAKGVSMSPYFASHLLAHLIDGEELMPDVKLERFF
ncbi:FAD-binding oxidoreductase [Chitinophagales bacterium]|nr:FAD-binding oxidoreductase [Chitinophagales bacterium]